MNKRIEAHVDSLFMNVQSGSYASDIKEELLANLNDKYNDLIKSGKNEEEAFVLVISGIGDINNLLKDLGEASGYQPLEIEKKRRESGIFVSIGVALYILSIVPIFLFGQSGNGEYGIALMFILCSVATGFIVYGNTVGKVKYYKTDNSFVEEYKEKLAVNDDRIKLRNSLVSSLWSLVVVLYLSFSFITGWWHISWIIFLVGACIQQIISYKFTKPEKRQKMWHGILWTVTLILYFTISFGINAWSWSWMIFLVAVSVEQIIRLIMLWKI